VVQPNPSPDPDPAPQVGGQVYPLKSAPSDALVLPLGVHGHLNFAPLFSLALKIEARLFSQLVGGSYFPDPINFCLVRNRRREHTHSSSSSLPSGLLHPLLKCTPSLSQDSSRFPMPVPMTFSGPDHSAFVALSVRLGLKVVCPPAPFPSFPSLFCNLRTSPYHYAPPSSYVIAVASLLQIGSLPFSLTSRRLCSKCPRRKPLFLSLCGLILFLTP